MRCMSRMAPGRVIDSTTFHLDAPEGVWLCPTCYRTVYRGEAARQMVRVARRRWAA